MAAPSLAQLERRVATIERKHRTGATLTAKMLPHLERLREIAADQADCLATTQLLLKQLNDMLEAPAGGATRRDAT